ncbi:MAG TPA: SxtJ family membrane protein [Draconibacterium sp.]|nr:SxtJ family membrane protein [Draconibacterium sp.]
MDRSKSIETSLVLTTGFLTLFLIMGNEWLLYLALAFGVIGIFVKPLANYVAIAWFKLADFLNFFMSKIILGTLFFVVLWPVSLLYKISNKDKLQIKKSKNSNWTERNHNFSSADLENIW